MNRLLRALCLLFLALPAAAQDKPSAQTAGDPKIALEALRYRLAPLTESRFATEVEAWIAIFAAKAQEITTKQIEALSADANAKTTLDGEIATLKTEREAILERIDLILASWQRKGGKAEDIAAHRKYLSEASGLVDDWLDLEAVWTTISTWLTSKSGGIRIGTNILLFLLTLLVFHFLSRIAGKIVSKVMGRVGRASDLLREFSVNFATKFTSLIGLIVALTMLGVDVTPFLAVLGAAGFIVGFALQGTLNNFAAGVMILFYRPFDVGNVVTVTGITGKVNAMTMSSTTITTGDNQVIIIPNGKIWGDIITNVTGSKTRRVDLVFGVSYRDDLAKTQAILEEVVANHKLVLADPKPVIRVHQLGASSVDFVCRPWTKTDDYWTVYWDLTRAVKERFDAEGISIPFPQTDVHLHQVSAS